MNLLSSFPQCDLTYPQHTVKTRIQTSLRHSWLRYRLEIPSIVTVFSVCVCMCTARCNFITRVDLSNYHYNQDTECSVTTKKLPCFSPFNSHTSIKLLAMTNLLSITVILSHWVHIQHATLWDQFFIHRNTLWLKLLRVSSSLYGWVVVHWVHVLLFNYLTF